MCDVVDICTACGRLNCRCQTNEPLSLKFFDNQDSYDESISEYPCCYVLERVSSESSCSAWDSPKQCLPVIPYNIVFSDNKIDVQLDSCNDKKDGGSKRQFPCRTLPPSFSPAESCDSPRSTEIRQSPVCNLACQEEFLQTNVCQECFCRDVAASSDCHQSVYPENVDEECKGRVVERIVERNPCRAQPCESKAECKLIKSPKLGKFCDDPPTMVDKSLDPIVCEEEQRANLLSGRQKRRTEDGEHSAKRLTFKNTRTVKTTTTTKDKHTQKEDARSEKSSSDDAEVGSDRNIAAEQLSSSSLNSLQLKLDEKFEDEETIRPREKVERSTSMRGGKGSPSLSKALANRKLQKALSSKEKLKASSTTELQMQKGYSWSDPRMPSTKDYLPKLKEGKVVEQQQFPPTPSQERSASRKVRNRRKPTRFPSGKSERSSYDSSRQGMCKTCGRAPCRCSQNIPAIASPRSTTKCNGCGKPRKWCLCNGTAGDQRCNTCGNRKKSCSCGAAEVSAELQKPEDIEITISEKNSELPSKASKRWVVPKIPTKPSCRIVPKKPAEWRNAWRIAPRCSARKSSTSAVRGKSCQNNQQPRAERCQLANPCCRTEWHESCCESRNVPDGCKCRVIPRTPTGNSQHEGDVFTLPSPPCPCSCSLPQTGDYPQCCVHSAITCSPPSQCVQSEGFVVPRTVPRSFTGGYIRSDENKSPCRHCHKIGVDCKCADNTKRLRNRTGEADETSESSLASSDDRTSEKSTTPYPQKNSANTSNTGTEFLSERAQTPVALPFILKSSSSSCSSSCDSRPKAGSVSPCSPTSVMTTNDSDECCKSCLQAMCQCHAVHRDCNDCWSAPTKIVPTDEERCSHMSKVIFNFQNSEIFQATYDVTIVIGLTLFPCHSVILMAHSDYFKQCFASRRSLARYLSKPPVRMSLEHTSISAEAFQFIHHWLYTADVCITSPCQAVCIWMAAKELAMPELVQECKRYVRQTLTIETAMEYWDQAMCYGLEELRNMAGRYLVANFPSVVNSCTFLCYSAEQVVRFLSDDELRMESEKDVFSAALRWLSYCWQDRKCQAEKILSCVRYVCMHPEELLECIYRNRNSEVLQDMDYLIRVIRQNT